MSYQVLARKWRPRNFESLVGQEHVVKALTHALDTQRLHHAYLFTGTRGVGKTTIARILAKSLNCETGITSKPCGKCSACTEIDAGRFVDLLEVDAATNTKVDEMRQLLENAVYAPTRGRFKVYVIDEVHMLSTSAFNAMLKTLEEPPEHIKFILATTDPQKIPVTVLSRCLQFNLKQMPASSVVMHLTRVLKEEGIEADEAALRLIAAGANGSMRDALSLLDQAIAFAGGKLGEAVVRDMLGTVDNSFLYRIVEALGAGDAVAALAVADEMEGRGISFDGALGELAALLHRIALAQLAPSALPEEGFDRDRVSALAGLLDGETVQLYYQMALHGRQDLPLAPDDYAGFTMALMRMLAFRPGAPSAPAASSSASGGGQARPAAPASGARGASPVPSRIAAAMPARSVATTPARGAADAAARTAALAPSRAATAAAQPAEVAKTSIKSAVSADSGGNASALRDAEEDWPAFARGLNVGGLAKQLAQQSELVRFEQEEIELRVPPVAKHLAEKLYQDKLRAALEEQFGQPVRLVVKVGELRGDTAQDRAVSSIQQDEFVRGLVEGLDATIVPASIKPMH